MANVTMEKKITKSTTVSDLDRAIATFKKIIDSDEKENSKTTAFCKQQIAKCERAKKKIKACRDKYSATYPQIAEFSSIGDNLLSIMKIEKTLQDKGYAVKLDSVASGNDADISIEYKNRSVASELARGFFTNGEGKFSLMKLEGTMLAGAALGCLGNATVASALGTAAKWLFSTLWTFSPATAIFAGGALAVGLVMGIMKLGKALFGPAIERAKQAKAKQIAIQEAVAEEVEKEEEVPVTPHAPVVEGFKQRADIINDLFKKAKTNKEKEGARIKLLELLSDIASAPEDALNEDEKASVKKYITENTKSIQSQLGNITKDLNEAEILKPNPDGTQHTLDEFIGEYNKLSIEHANHPSDLGVTGKIDTFNAAFNGGRRSQKEEFVQRAADLNKKYNPKQPNNECKEGLLQVLDDIMGANLTNAEKQELLTQIATSKSQLLEDVTKALHSAGVLPSTTKNGSVTEPTPQDCIKKYKELFEVQGKEGDETEKKKNQENYNNFRGVFAGEHAKTFDAFIKQINELEISFEKVVKDTHLDEITKGMELDKCRTKMFSLISTIYTTPEDGSSGALTDKEKRDLIQKMTDTKTNTRISVEFTDLSSTARDLDDITTVHNEMTNGDSHLSKELFMNSYQAVLDAIKANPNDATVTTKIDEFDALWEDRKDETTGEVKSSGVNIPENYQNLKHMLLIHIDAVLKQAKDAQKAGKTVTAENILDVLSGSVVKE